MRISKWTVVAVATVAGLLLALIVAGCGGDDSQDTLPTGPLAIYAGEWNGDDALAEGILVLEGKCLYLESSTAGTLTRFLVAFAADGTSWSEAERAVTIPGATYRVGTLVGLGGSEAITGRTMEWVVPPAESCDQTHIWGAGRP
ncbi:MAG: hypothetical protein HY875_05950 [Chloroflexi bacterium]|nr:hypothetical protein [Chloroflexota bacterium]